MENIKVFSKCEKTENEFHYCHNFNILISSLCPMSLKVRMIFTKCQPCLFVSFPLGQTNEGQMREQATWQQPPSLPGQTFTEICLFVIFQDLNFASCNFQIIQVQRNLDLKYCSSVLKSRQYLLYLLLSHKFISRELKSR